MNMMPVNWVVPCQETCYFLNFHLGIVLQVKERLEAYEKLEYVDFGSHEEQVSSSWYSKVQQNLVEFLYEQLNAVRLVLVLVQQIASYQ